eukprot:272239-Rhodomonas_salina.1
MVSLRLRAAATRGAARKIKTQNSGDPPGGVIGARSRSAGHHDLPSASLLRPSESWPGHESFKLTTNPSPASTIVLVVSGSGGRFGRPHITIKWKPSPGSLSDTA